MGEAFSLPFFRTALAASLVLAGIHTYLGYHVVRRGVIFVDLALAQMAALGLASAVVLGVAENSAAAYLLPLAMTFIGAVVFSWLRGHARHAPLEAFIGIVFATAQALVFLVLEKQPAGPEHLKESLFGSLFTVAPRHVVFTAVLYAVIGLVHLLMRRGLLDVTSDPEGARRRGRRIFWWDLLFYGTFGLVVTSSVQIAGVLLVFGLLVIPAVAALMATRGVGRALVHGWVFGFAGCLLGLIASVRADAPAAPSILVALTVLLALEGVVLRFFRSLTRRDNREMPQLSETRELRQVHHPETPL